MCLKPYDRTLFGNFDLDELPEHQRSQVFIGTPEDLAIFDVVIGHYSVQMLRSGRDLDDLVVLFREPRSRLLSLYTFWRSCQRSNTPDGGGTAPADMPQIRTGPSSWMTPPSLRRPTTSQPVSFWDSIG